MMAEWHITPDYILNNWSDELFNLMLRKLNERKQRESESYDGSGEDKGEVVSEEVFLAKAGHMVKAMKGTVQYGDKRRGRGSEAKTG